MNHERAIQAACKGHVLPEEDWRVATVDRGKWKLAGRQFAKTVAVAWASGRQLSLDN